MKNICISASLNTNSLFCICWITLAVYMPSNFGEHYSQILSASEHLRIKKKSSVKSLK